MTPEQATFLLNDIYLPQIRQEHATTRRVIQAVPVDQCSWKPDPKCMSALELAWHIASAEPFFMNGIVERKFTPGGSSMPDSIKTPAEVLTWYDENFAAAVARFAQAKGEDLVQPVDFFGMFNLPGISYAGFMVSHSIHHRGQLSSYLRPMGAKVPGIYGPSGDEPMTAPATA